MNSLKPKQLLVFDALLLEQPFFELHPRHHQSRRHYFHPQNHAFHSGNSFLIYFFFSSQLRGPELGIKCHQRVKSHLHRGFPHDSWVMDHFTSMLNKPFRCFLLLNYFPCHHHHWMIYRYLVILACPTLIWVRMGKDIPSPMYCLLTLNRDIGTVTNLNRQTKRPPNSGPAPELWTGILF